MEQKRVTANELIDFVEKNYLYNIWNNGISKLVEMYPTMKGYLGTSQNFSDEEIEWSKVEYSDNVLCLKITLNYGYGDRKIFLCKKNETFYLFAEFLSLLEEEKILSEIDFSNLYEYYDSESFSSTNYNIKATYDSNYGKYDNMKIYISEGRKIVIGNDSYSIEYNTYNGNMYFHENSSDHGLSSSRVRIDEFEAKGLYASDPNFFDNITVAFEDLPKYIQDTLYDNPFDSIQQEKEKTKSLKMVLEGLFKKTPTDKK